MHEQGEALEANRPLIWHRPRRGQATRNGEAADIRARVTASIAVFPPERLESNPRQDVRGSQNR